MLGRLCPSGRLTVKNCSRSGLRLVKRLLVRRLGLLSSGSCSHWRMSSDASKEPLPALPDLREGRSRLLDLKEYLSTLADLNELLLLAA